MGFPRLHLFEFEDLRWIPRIFRKFITDLLAYQIKRFGIYAATVDKLVEVLGKTEHNVMIDLCSGSGGPALGVREQVSKAIGRDIHLVLTDKYPNLEAFTTVKGEHVTPIQDSIDALKVTSTLKGLRTLFTAFHHFKPKQAQNILKSSVDAQMPIGVFEITERKSASLMTLIIAPITCLIFSLFVRPFKISRFFWTYIIPVIPLLYTWDGLVSNMRTYTKQEWEEMTKPFQDYFIWEIGELVSKFHIKITYLIGYPKITSKQEVTEAIEDKEKYEVTISVRD